MNGNKLDTRMADLAVAQESVESRLRQIQAELTLIFQQGSIERPSPVDRKTSSSERHGVAGFVG